jgi:hypothetical protein
MSPTSTHRPWPPSPSAWPSAASPCADRAGPVERGDRRAPRRRRTDREDPRGPHPGEAGAAGPDGRRRCSRTSRGWYGRRATEPSPDPVPDP